MKAFRGSILHFNDDHEAIYKTRPWENYQYFEDGVLLVDEGVVVVANCAEVLADQGLDLNMCEDYSGKLIMPGFIDSHVHAPQTEIIASYGEQLLDWLNNYTFPAELKFSDPNYAQAATEFFLDQLMSNGTTTAMVYTTVFRESTQLFFETAHARNLRMIAGKVMMDRHAPAGLLDDAMSSEKDSRQLIHQWHNNGRLSYCVTPRFAPTSSPEQLEAAGRILNDIPDVYLQTHLSENLGEIAWVKSLYPHAKDYLDVYDHYGLLTSRSVFGHGIHLSDREIGRLAETGAGIAFCPTSNLFLGSGLLNLARLESLGVNVSIATDVGGGTSFSLLKTLSDAYKVLQLQQQSLSVLKGLYMATLGNARALTLDRYIGNFSKGKEADFNVIDLGATPLQQYRKKNSRTLEEILFSLMILGDEHNIFHTYIKGKRWYFDKKRRFQPSIN